MTRRQRRMALVASLVLGVSAIVVVATQVFEQNLMYFYSATELQTAPPAADSRIRFGGLVVPGSVDRVPGEIEVQFVLADCEHAVPVAFAGILPDLFREGQGIVASGFFRDGVFEAEEVLAKHDENYMPPELAQALGAEGGQHSCAPFKSLEEARS